MCQGERQVLSAENKASWDLGEILIWVTNGHFTQDVALVAAIKSHLPRLFM